MMISPSHIGRVVTIRFIRNPRLYPRTCEPLTSKGAITEVGFDKYGSYYFLFNRTPRHQSNLLCENWEVIEDHGLSDPDVFRPIRLLD